MPSPPTSPLTDARGSPHFKTFSFRQTAQELDDAVAWLSTKVRRIDGNRVARYRKHLHQLADQIESGELQAIFDAAPDDKKGKMFAEVLVSLYESSEIISIYHGIKAVAGVMEPGKLKALLKGPISYIDERADSAKARDISFELIVASRFHQVGLKLEQLLPADICAVQGRDRIVFECKRPQSINSIEANISDAFGQLRKRLENPSISRLRGIAAIDVTKAANPSFGRLRVSDLNELTRLLSDAGEQYAQEQVLRWLGRAPSRVAAVLLRFSVIAEIIQSKTPVYAQQYFVVSLGMPNTRNQRVARALAVALQRPPASAGIVDVRTGILASN